MPIANLQNIILKHKEIQMTIKQSTILFLALCGLLVSCFDLYSTRQEIDGPYFVESDPVANYKTLYFDIGNEDAIARVENVKRVGHTDKYIIVETQDGYRFIDRQKDNKFLNGNEIVGDTKTHDYFLNWLDTSKIEDFKFDYYLEK
jgi:hypothetical protein